MSEIEKLFELAGIEKSKCWDDCTTCTRTSCDKNISYIKADYPPFTAEKQLELIKWMIKTNHRYFILDVFECEFEESLAKVLNLYWQDLTDKEKTEIAEILKG